MAGINKYSLDWNGYQGDVDNLTDEWWDSYNDNAILVFLNASFFRENCDVPAHYLSKKWSKMEKWWMRVWDRKILLTLAAVTYLLFKKNCAEGIFACIDIQKESQSWNEFPLH